MRNHALSGSTRPSSRATPRPANGSAPRMSTARAPPRRRARRARNRTAEQQLERNLASSQPAQVLVRRDLEIVAAQDRADRTRSVREAEHRLRDVRPQHRPQRVAVALRRAEQFDQTFAPSGGVAPLLRLDLHLRAQRDGVHRHAGGFRHSHAQREDGAAAYCSGRAPTIAKASSLTAAVRRQPAAAALRSRRRTRRSRSTPSSPPSKPRQIVRISRPVRRHASIGTMKQRAVRPARSDQRPLRRRVRASPAPGRRPTIVVPSFEREQRLRRARRAPDRTPSSAFGAVVEEERQADRDLGAAPRLRRSKRKSPTST